MRKHFQEVVTAVEESVEAVSCDPGHQRTRLQQTYTDIMNAAKQGGLKVNTPVEPMYGVRMEGGGHSLSVIPSQAKGV